MKIVKSLAAWLCLVPSTECYIRYEAHDSLHLDYCGQIANQSIACNTTSGFVMQGSHLYYKYIGPQSVNISANNTLVGQDHFMFKVVDREGRASLPTYLNVTAESALLAESSPLRKAPLAIQGIQSNVTVSSYECVCFVIQYLPAIWYRYR